MDDKKKRINELVELLNRASAAYYGDGDEIMSNFEWDAKFDELSKLEQETGYILENTPTNNVGVEISDGNREKHEYPALSLKKDKNRDALKKWAGKRPIWLSWKLDGITLVTTYDGGKLIKLLTRGNGIVGKNITALAPYIRGIPLTVKYNGHMVVRGEAMISYSRFEYINNITDIEDGYKNPRNLVSGTLDTDVDKASEIESREVHFKPFTLVYCDEDITSWGDRMDFLEELGFDVVDREFTDAEHLDEVIDRWTDRVNSFDFPVDGLVITYDDTIYASQGTVTGRYANNAGMAYKWEDIVAETVLNHIEWSCATNVISPVAVFETVDLEGTRVSRASLCNISEMKRLGIGADGITKLKIIKANKIIPKCIAADSCGTKFTIPSKCPVCEMPTKIITSGKTNTETLCCTNSVCPAKDMNKFVRFVSRSGLDIDGLSIMTIKMFMNKGFLRNFEDIFYISKYMNDIIAMDGFGRKSYDNLKKSIEKARKCDYIRFLHALSIPMIGTDTAKKIMYSIGSAEFENRVYNNKTFEDIDGIGIEKSNSIMQWFSNHKNLKTYNALKNILLLDEFIPVTSGGKCNGKTFVITGKLESYKNRDEIVAYIESQGGKVADSISKKTNYLINNNSQSSSSKNKKAMALDIPIITEKEFVDRFGFRE